MDLEKSAARQLASYPDFDSLTAPPAGRLARPVPPTRVISSTLAAARALSDRAPTLSSRKSRIASALTDLPVPAAQPLQEYFDLTLAEVRLAQSLARGLSLEEAARYLNIKMSTARTQLAAVFAKTGSQRQGKLIAILSRIAHMS